MEANADLVNLVDSYLSVKQRIALLQNEQEEITFKIKKAMGEEPLLCTEGKIIVSYKQDSDSIRFDTDKFKTEQPELYTRYLKDVKGSRKFLIPEVSKRKRING